MQEARFASEANPVSVDKPSEEIRQLASAAGMMNLLYENFQAKWLKELRGPNSPIQLKTVFEQSPPHIIADISPRDTMYTAGWEQHYASVGQSALQAIRLAMLAVGKVHFKRILDLPCGHGRIQRVLRAAFPDAEITACDLDFDGVDFCVQTFGAIPLYSAEKPEMIPLKESYDLIWCGSLLTHLDQPFWPGFLQLFSSHLAPGGLLVFTTHGRESVRWLRTGKFDYSLADVPAILAQYDRYGFGYQDYPAHTHRNYGISTSSPAWVMEQLLKWPSLRLVGCTEKGLDNHQDVFACVRT